MKIRSTLIALSLVLGLMSCSYNSGVLKEAQPATPQNATLKATGATPSGTTPTIHLFMRGVDNTQFIAGGGILTHVDLVRKGNVKSGIKEKRVTIFDGATNPKGPEHFNDLLSMNSGIMLDLSDGQVNPPAGNYDYAVATVQPGSGWIEAKDGKKYTVKFPGNKFMLAFKPAIQIKTVISTDVVLDIDVSRSFVKTGKSYIFKPVVKVQNNTTTGSAIGVVIDGNGNVVPNANVYVDYGNGATYGLEQVNAYDPTINSQGSLDYLSSAFGYPVSYWIPGIYPGTFTIYAAKDGYNTASEQVTIYVGNFTYASPLILTKK